MMEFALCPIVMMLGFITGGCTRYALYTILMMLGFITGGCTLLSK